MKKVFLLLALNSCAAPLFSHTLFAYGKDKVSKDEFLRAYDKNKPLSTDKEKSLREYLDLYSRFKLKVKAARDLQLDTLPQLQTDIQNFHSQIENNYMIDEKGVRGLLAKIGYKKNDAINEKELFAYADSTAKNNNVGNYPINDKTIFSFGHQNIKGSEWLNYAKGSRQISAENITDKELWDRYLSAVALGYYQKHLEEYNADFKYQMQEFKEGNMLFEIMERNVWNKAANDSTGLLKYYNQHKTNYLWTASAEVVLFNCTNSKSAENAVTALRNGETWKNILQESNGTVRADSGRYEIAQLPWPQGTQVYEGLITTPVINATDNTASFVKIVTMYPAKQQRSFEEARGLVINDYQNYLEEKWVAGLEKEYPIKVNETVFKSLLH